MKRTIITLFLLTFGATSYSQDTEFGKSTNGLIYSDKTIKELKSIVDSLNLKFKVCDLNKIYKSKLQCKANYIYLEKGKIKEAKKDIESNISYNDFIKKYRTAEVEKGLLVVKFQYKNYKGKEEVGFNSMELDNKYQHEFNFEEDISTYDKPLEGKWVYQYSKKTNYSEESIEAFYFTEEFYQKPIPAVYARMIQYSDCMVDTTAQVFYENANKSGVRYVSDGSSKSNEFLDYIHKSINKPEYTDGFNDKDYEIYSKKYSVWDSLRISRVDSLKMKDENFNKLLIEAVNESLTKGNTDDEFEEYVGRYYSKKTELELKRNRRVVGGCSMDNSPRVHAINIAKLSAETTNWEIFLRSHLDILNDRFERVSDGSYAWEKRKTYIKELEVLDINVLDLLLGITFRIENPSANHYYGNIGRLGKALSESNKSSELEMKMLEMISDNQLDDYNRILIYYLFLNYNYNLENKEMQVANNEKLKEAIKMLPEYLLTKMVAEK